MAEQGAVPDADEFAARQGHVGRTTDQGAAQGSTDEVTEDSAGRSTGQRSGFQGLQLRREPRR
jgi:hypothetical protein